jgi:RecB family endonuclease NucS
MPYESSIRDQLAKKLQLIESGLTCAGIEFRLDSIDGGSCFIDILARDRNSHIVAIEAKVHDGAARQAMHELNKYSG